MIIIQTIPVVVEQLRYFNRDLLQIEDSVLFSVHDHRSETSVARIEYSEIFDGK